MNQSIRLCSIESCEASVGSRGAKGLCPKHYRESRPPCTVGQCFKVQVANGYCSMHNYRYRSTGNPLTTRSGRMVREPGTLCTFPECGNPQRKREWCAQHYNQFRAGKELKPLRTTWAEYGSPCVICGKPAPGRSNYCGSACSAVSARYAAIGETRPQNAECVMCGKPIDLTKRNGNRLQRADVLWCHDCGRESPAATRLKKYGVSPDEYSEAMLRGCDICGNQPGYLEIDHDHECCETQQTCGECVRGFLCGNCNRGLGLLQDNVDVLTSAIAYLSSRGD